MATTTETKHVDSKPVELKHRVSRVGIEALSTHLEAFEPSFPRRSFVRRATQGLEDLELKARIEHVADALTHSLPPDFDDAARIIDGANTLRTSTRDQTHSRGPDQATDDGSAFAFWPLCTYVETRGLSRPDRALQTMHGLTQLASCEFAIRPYIERDQGRVLARLQRWATDPNHHVRRLVSEGTRPRLPWGGRLRDLQADPSPSLPLLETLFDDPELYVRRSVANHLNDISKDHPQLAVDTATRWRRAKPTPEVDWVIRHALRGLIKAGHPGALQLQGFGPPKIAVERFTISPARLRLGGALQLELELRAKTSQSLLIDYAVHHMKANGTLSPKVFKWTRREVLGAQSLTLTKTHSIRPITTRRYHAGLHRVELLINGVSFGLREFELTGVG